MRPRRPSARLRTDRAEAKKTERAAKRAAAAAERVQREEARAAERARKEDAEAAKHPAAVADRAQQEEAPAVDRAKQEEADAARREQKERALAVERAAKASERVEREEARAAARAAKELGREPSAKTALFALIGFAAVSTLVRVALVLQVHTALVFSDELGYEKVAQSIGRDGKLALFNAHGLSYSPLYPALLSPIYALGASATTAYSLIKVVNALLISLSAFPTYKIARSVLSRYGSLLVAGLSAVAPLMFYSSFTISENLAYPLCLTAVWAMLNAVREPTPRNDALLVAAIVVACVARIELIVLAPAALTAVLLTAPPPRRKEYSSADGRVTRAAKEHGVLFAAAFTAVLLEALLALAGGSVLAVAGRYSNISNRGFPDPWHLAEQLARHLAGLDLALGVVPFVGALVAAAAFARQRFRLDKLPFAAVAFAVTAWFLVEVAFDAALFDGPNGDVPRIHERFLIYVMPLFLTAALAAVRAKASLRVCLGAAAAGAALPAVIPFHTVVNRTISADTFGLEPLAHWRSGRLVPISHITIVAIVAAAFLGLLYVGVRRRADALAILMLIPFVLISSFSLARIQTSTAHVRTLLPHRADWVDAAKPIGYVVLIGGRKLDDRVAQQTAYDNLSIRRLYYVCRTIAGSEFGERRVTVDRRGGLRGPSGLVHTNYAVAPAALGLRGRVVARNRNGHEVLVAPASGRLTVPRARRHEFACR